MLSASLAVFGCPFLSRSLTISSCSSYLLCCWKLPDPLCAGQHCCCCHLIVMFMCSAMAFTSCQPCHKSVPISITVIAFLIDTFGNWLTFRGRSGTDKLVTEPTFTLNHLRVSSYGPGRKNELID